MTTIRVGQTGYGFTQRAFDVMKARFPHDSDSIIQQRLIEEASLAKASEVMVSEAFDTSTFRARTIDGTPLTAGVNVDAIDIDAGVKMAVQLGYSDGEAKMVAEMALARHQRGEEASAERLWLSQYPHDLTSWYAILAAAMASAQHRCDFEADGGRCVQHRGHRGIGHIVGRE